jgi:hypothetical protein
MKKLTLSLAILMIAFTSLLFAQDRPKNVVAVTAVYNRADVNIKNLQGETRGYDAARDSIGGEFTYVRFPAKYLGIGIEAGVTFHNQDVSGVVSCGPGCTITNSGTSKVARGYANYAMYLQDTKGTFQPYVKGVVGIQRGNFDGVTFVPSGAQISGGSSFIYGAGAGIDLCFGSKKGTCWRNGVTVTKGFNSDITQANVLFQTGLAFKF